MWRRSKKNRKSLSAANYQRATQSPADKVRWVSPFFIIGIVVLAIYFLWSYLSSEDTLAFKHVKLIASAHYVSPQVLQKIVHEDLKGGFFSLDTKALRDDLLALPWVSSVSIRKIWPTSLLIRVKEQVPIAEWNHRAIINEYGALFYPATDSIPKTLPKLVGPNGTEQQVLDMFHVLTTDISVLGLTLNTLVLSDRLSWSLQLSNGIQVELGQDDVPNRFKQFIRLYPQIIGEKSEQTTSVDLRYTDGIAVKIGKNIINHAKE